MTSIQQKLIFCFTLCLLFLGTSILSRAFHEGGVAACNGCHTMHNSEDGLPVNPDSPAGSPMLLIFDNSSDVCLSCHATSFGSVLGPDPLNPPTELGAGNFTYLFEDNINDAPDGASDPIPGYRAGHNIVTESWGIAPDPENLVAPGGSFPSDGLGCTSCHDPHGTDRFRMLRGAGPVGDTGYVFSNPAPSAEGIDVVLGPSQGSELHTAYQAGWADWCANCHGNYHDNHAAGFEHPADHALEGDQSRTYNGYNGPDDPHGGQYGAAYIEEVPFEDPAMTLTGTFGSTPSSRVMCMSCHRAHATSAPASVRWDPNVLLLDSDGVVSGSRPLPNPYSHPDQRALCVKCHYDDAVDHGWDSPCMDCHANLLRSSPSSR